MYFFIDQIQRNFNLEDLTEAHWDIITEILKIREVNKEEYPYLTAPTLKRKILFLMKNNKPIEETVKKFIKEIMGQNCYYRQISTKIFKDFPDFERQFLLAISKYLGTSTDPEKRQRCHLYEMIFDFNKRHPKIAIDLQNIDLLRETVGFISSV